MATPLSAIHRLTLNYNVAGFSHVLRAYCARGADVSGVPQLLARDAVSLVSVPSAAQGLWDLIREVHPSGTLAATGFFEARSGLVWNPIIGLTPTGAGTGGAATLAQQETITVRDANFNKIKVVIMESDQGYIGHSASGLGINSEVDDQITRLNGTDTDANAPFNWMKSRGNAYISATSPIAGVTMDLNDKLKRRRGLE